MLHQIQYHEPSLLHSKLYFLWCIYSQLMRFAKVYSNVDDFNNRNLFLTAKFLKVIDIIKFEKHFLNSTTDTQS